MQAIQSIRHVDHSSFSIICCGHRIVVACEAVTHVSKFANEVVIYTLTGNYNAQHSLKEILDALPRNKFYRIHRSHIISLDLLGNMRQNCIFINGYCLPFSGYYKSQLYQRLQIRVNKHYNFYELA